MMGILDAPGSAPPGRSAGEAGSIRFRPSASQRDLMRGLRAALGDDRDAVCLAYLEAERAGRAERPCGARDMPPQAHARTLWQDGKLKGWLRA